MAAVFNQDLPPVASGELMVALREASEGPIVMLGKKAFGESQLGQVFEQLSKTEDLVVPVPWVDLLMAPVLHTLLYRSGCPTKAR